MRQRPSMAEGNATDVLEPDSLESRIVRWSPSFRAPNIKFRRLLFVRVLRMSIVIAKL